MKEKYVDERYPMWLTFAPAIVTSSVADWTVRTPSMADADLLVSEHHKVHDALVRCALAFAEAAPEAFTQFWYGSELQSTPEDGTCVRCGAAPRHPSGLCATCLDEDAERYENAGEQTG